MAKQKEETRFGDLPPSYNFSLNPYPDMRFTSCPRYQAKAWQRKLPLLIHIDPSVLTALNYTNRYCKRCDLLLEELRMTMEGWFPKGQEPPMMEPPAPTEWVK